MHFDSDLFWIPYYDRVPTSPILEIGSVQAARGLLAIRPNDVYMSFNKGHKVNGRLYILHLEEIDGVFQVHIYWIDFGTTEWINLSEIKVPLWTAELNRPSNLFWINFSCGRDAILPNQPITIKIHKDHELVQNFDLFKNILLASISCNKTCNAPDIWSLYAPDDVITAAYTPPAPLPFMMYQTRRPERQFGTFTLLQQEKNLYNPNNLCVNFIHDVSHENGEIAVSLDFEDEMSGTLITHPSQVPKAFHMACRSASINKLTLTGFIRWDSSYEKWFASMPELRSVIRVKRTWSSHSEQDVSAKLNHKPFLAIGGIKFT